MTSQGIPPQAQSSEIITGPAAQAMQAHQAEQEAKPGFADQVKGYAKEFAGKTFGKEHEQAQGEAVRKGELAPQEAKSAITKESVQSGGQVGSTTGSSATGSLHK